MWIDRLGLRASQLAKRPILTCGLLALAVLAVFWPVIGSEFISYDDPLYVTQNTLVQRGLTGAGLRWAFGTGVGGSWHPVTWLSHMLDCQLYGLT